MAASPRSPGPQARSLSLRDGVAVVTGAAGGIGAALAQALARRGCHLALVDLRPEGLAITARGARAAGVRVTEHVLDLADAGALAGLPAAVAGAHGGATILVNNAGVALGGRFEQLDLADVEWLMAINFWAPLRLVHAFLPQLAAAPAAQIVNVSSIFGIIAPPGQSAYAASKFALRGFSESLRHELDGSGVGVTLVHPGGVRTGIATGARPPRGASPEDLAREQAAWDRLLTLSPEAAAARMLRGIERREPRVLVGSDAARAALVQRLFPVDYWRHVARDLARRIGRAA